MPLVEQPTTRRGRPPRAQIEVIRVVTWYYAVRRASRWTERHLETHFDKLDRVGLGRHRGSRWNKYKAGITTPRQDLLAQVERKFKGTRQVFDHPVWSFAASTNISARDLGELIAALPPDVAELFCRHDAKPGNDFWMRSDLDHRTVIEQIQHRYRGDEVTHLTALSGLLAQVHISRIRQQEDAHFEAHLAVVSVASAEADRRRDKFSDLCSWRLESLLLDKWLDTEYTVPAFREAIRALRAITSGPPAPWVPRQTSLKLGRGPNKREIADLQNGRGYWSGQRLLVNELPTGCGPWPCPSKPLEKSRS